MVQKVSRRTNKHVSRGKTNQYEEVSETNNQTNNYIERNACSWMTFLTLNGIAMKTLGGKLGNWSIPLVITIWGISRSTTYFYDLYHGTATKSYIVYLRKSMSFAYLIAFLLLIPISVLLILAHYLT